MHNILELPIGEALADKLAAIQRGREAESLLRLVFDDMVDAMLEQLGAPPVADVSPSKGEELAAAEQEPEAQPEWPQMASDGVMVDVNGCPHLPGIHSSGKTCVASGAWRRAKGVAPDTANASEQEAIATRLQSLLDEMSARGQAEEAQLATAVQATNEPSEPPVPHINVTLEQILAGIASAPNQTIVDEWVNSSLKLGLYPAGRARVDEAVTNRVRELLADQPGTIDFESIKTLIEKAASATEIGHWLERARHIVITQGQRYALEACADERKRQLAAAERAA